MKKIILVRHTETILLKGDSPLSPWGVKQAQSIAKFLEEKNHNYEIAITSLYKRAQETAILINKTKNKNIIPSSAFNEYLVQDDGTEVETTTMGVARAMTKIYSLFDIWENVLLVAHGSINRTILRSLLNLEYEKAEEYFRKFGETHVLRYDWKKGDNCWRIIDSFIPKQKKLKP